ncbi:MAG: glycoside hydrolase family 127 protein, partial [Armatimonadetes bacterium]|nr:glycoside hydrolase family 127 protein [Armatimonadota bacterium]
MKEPACDRARHAQFQFHGILASYLKGVSDQWLKVAPLANPGMLEMFRDRDRKPLRDLVPWAGEFAGKYLTGAVQVLRLTGDPELRALLSQFVRELIGLQAEDGYLGPWPEDSRLTGSAPNVMGTQGGTWDAWGHYHVMLGLMLWHEETGDKAALKSVTRIGDLLCDRFLGRKSVRLVDTGSTEMNLAPVHSLGLLYRKTKTRRFLDLALQIVEEFSATDTAGQPLAGDYLNTALAGKEFFQTPKPRWESLHPILGLVELYYLTGDQRYRDAFEHIWWSIVKLDRHNNGGFSSGEQAQGNPYHPGAIETCCTIAWTAMSVEMLKLSGNSIVADELELTMLNSVVGMHSHSGRWATYNTPMDGLRRASAHEIVFQSREGTPELNCCSVNSARGFGMISEWALMQDRSGLILNYYGPCSMQSRLPSGVQVRLSQETDYPVTGEVMLRIDLSRPTEFQLQLRIPHWSRTTKVKLNGEAVPHVQAGAYLSLHRRWQRGDEVTLTFDMSLHYWVGEQECEGKVSIFRGPILLTYDRRFNDMDPDALPVLDARGLRGRRVKPQGANSQSSRISPILLMEFPTRDGGRVRLCDFGSAG